MADDIPIEQIIQELSVSFEPFFLIPDPKRANECADRWRHLLGDHVIEMASPRDTCQVAATIVALTEGALRSVSEAGEQLKASGFDNRRVAGIVQAISPYAEALQVTCGKGRHR